MNKSGVFWGILLVVIGLLLMVNNLFDWQFLSMKRLWPIFILIPGLAFEFAYFSRSKDPGLLVPGGILTVLGLLFFFETFTQWRFAEYTWPVYPLAVAVGLFQLYLFSGRQRGLLIPVLILTAVSCISFAAMFIHALGAWINLGIMVPALLIVFGLVIVIRSFRSKS